MERAAVGPKAMIKKRSCANEAGSFELKYLKAQNRSLCDVRIQRCQLVALRQLPITGNRMCQAGGKLL